MDPERNQVAAPLRAAQLRWHAETAPMAASASAVAGGVMVLLLWPAPGAAAALSWLAVLAAVLALRVGLVAAARDGAGAPERWLRRHRAAIVLHGLVWALAVLLIGRGADGDTLHAAIFLVTGMVGGALVTGGHDPTAARLFAAPPAAMLVARLLGWGGTAEPMLATVAVVFAVTMAVAGARTTRLLVEAVQARVAERQRLAEAEAARRQADEQGSLLRQLIHDTPKGFWHIGPDGRTLDLNPAMCTLLGRPRDEVLGRPVTDFFRGPARATLEAELERRRLGQAGGYEIEVWRPDGSRRHAFNQATPVHDAAGRTLGSIGLWTDLSPQKALEQELRVYERIANSITDQIAVLDAQRRYLVVNDAWCEAWALPRERVLGGPFGLERGGPPDPALAPALERCFETGHVAVVDARTWLPVGRDAALQTTLFPYRDGGPGVQRVILVTRDVTEQERRHLELQLSEQALRSTLNATGDAIFASDAADPDQPVRFVNDPLVMLFGLMRSGQERPTPRQILEAALPMFADPALEQQRIQHLIRHNEPGLHRVRLRDGRVLLRRCEPVWVAGRWLRVWSFRDVTPEERLQALVLEREAERGALAASEAEMRALLQAFPGLIGVVDEELRYVYVNAGLAQELGHEAGALVGRPVREVLGEARYADALADTQRARAGELVRRERSNPPNARRGRFDVDITYVAGPRGADGQRRFYVFGTDVTARNLAQEALAAARDEAERASRAKSQFLSHVSHELRTPLNAIAGFAQLLRRDARPPLAPVQQAWVGQILHASEHLLGLINEVLDLSGIEAGRLRVERQTVDLAAAVAEAQALVQALAREHEVQLLAPAGLEGLAALADRRRLRQVLLNLLGNAIKYNRPGGTVQVRGHAEGEAVWLEVQDTGRGIATADQARLFVPFERLDAARGPVEGTGIGLALSQRLVEAMGGRIALHSVPGQGSRFGVRLPAARQGMAGPPPTRLLYVDDNEVNLMVVKALADSVPGFEVETLGDAVSGLARIAHSRPDLVLMDLHMPGMDGFQALAALRADPATEALPVVALTADSDPADLERAVAAGFSEVLTKPLDLDRLLGTVARLVHGAAVPDSAA